MHAILLSAPEYFPLLIQALTNLEHAWFQHVHVLATLLSITNTLGVV